MSQDAIMFSVLHLWYVLQRVLSWNQLILYTSFIVAHYFVVCNVLLSFISIWCVSWFNEGCVLFNTWYEGVIATFIEGGGVNYKL